MSFVNSYPWFYEAQCLHNRLSIQNRRCRNTKQSENNTPAPLETLAAKVVATQTIRTGKEIFSLPLPPKLRREIILIWTTVDINTWTKWTYRQLEPITWHVYLRATEDYEKNTPSVGRLAFILTTLPLAKSPPRQWNYNEEDTLPRQMDYHVFQSNTVTSTRYTITSDRVRIDSLCEKCAMYLQTIDPPSMGKNSQVLRQQEEWTLSYGAIIPEVITNIFYEYCRLCRTKPLYTFSSTEPPAIAA